MKNKYQTLYATPYGTVTAQFKDEMTYEEAEIIGIHYCRNNNFIYLRTELVE